MLGRISEVSFQYENKEKIYIIVRPQTELEVRPASSQDRNP